MAITVHGKTAKFVANTDEIIIATSERQDVADTLFISLGGKSIIEFEDSYV